MRRTDMKEIMCYLIDDDLDDQEIFALALEQVGKGLSCVAMTNPHEALANLGSTKTHLPDYIFLDLNMPRMNGKEFLKEMKKFEHLNHIPVVIYSTSSLHHDIVESKNLGADHFITKPFSMTELVKVLQAFFPKEYVETSSLITS